MLKISSLRLSSLFTLKGFTRLSRFYRSIISDIVLTFTNFKIIMKNSRHMLRKNKIEPSKAVVSKFRDTL